MSGGSQATLQPATGETGFRSLDGTRLRGTFVVPPSEANLVATHHPDHLHQLVLFNPRTSEALFRHRGTFWLFRTRQPPSLMKTQG
jgi:hypothetical protein